MRTPDLTALCLKDTATAILVLTPTLFMINTLLLFCGLAVSAWSIPVAVAVGSFVVAYRLTDRRVTVFAVTFLGQAAILMAAIQLAGMFADIWYDSRVYHGPATIMLADGWNTVYDGLRLPASDVRTTSDLFMFHYPRANWINSAAIYSAVGHLDKASALNLVMALSSFLAVQRYLKSRTTVGRTMSFLLAGIIAANPVVVAQLFSGYLDGVLFSALVVLLFTMLHYVESLDRLSLYLGLLYLIFLVNLKFTGVVYAVAIMAVILLYQAVLYRKLPRTLLTLSVATGIAAMVVFGYSPYVVNTVEHGSPFYPAFGGESKDDVLQAQANDEFLSLTRIEQLAVANFSVASGDFKSKPRFVVPFTVRWFFPSVDARFSGFGPFFGVVFLAALPLVLSLRRSIHLIVIIGVFLSVLSTSAAWWARLAPQLWLVPILLIVAAWSVSSWRPVRLYCIGLVGLLALNSFLVCDSVWSLQYSAAQELEEISSMEVTTATITDPSFGFYSIRRLQDIGIEITAVDQCEVPHESISHRVIAGLSLCLDQPLR